MHRLGVISLPSLFTNSIHIVLRKGRGKICDDSTQYLSSKAVGGGKSRGNFLFLPTPP